MQDNHEWQGRKENGQFSNGRKNLDDDFTEIDFNEFGKVYIQKKYNPLNAARFLAIKKSGYIKNVFINSQIGSIDLCYGDDKKGLCHIIKKHIKELKDFNSLDEAIRIIDDTIKNGELKILKNGRIKIEKNRYRILLTKEKNKRFIITAYDKDTPLNKKKINKSIITLSDLDNTYERHGTLVAVGSSMFPSIPQTYEKSIQKSWCFFTINKKTGETHFYIRKTAYDAYYETKNKGDKKNVSLH